MLRCCAIRARSAAPGLRVGIVGAPSSLAAAICGPRASAGPLAVTGHLARVGPCTQIFSGVEGHSNFLFFNFIFG